MTFRKPDRSELKWLNNLIRISKGYWGYDQAFLDSFIKEWGLKLEYLLHHHIEVFEIDHKIVGILHMSAQSKLGEPYLADLFIHPNYIGKGYGKILWQRAVEYSLQQNWQSFYLLADPNATEFYHHMGAEIFDYFESKPGRFIPMMRYKLS